MPGAPGASAKWSRHASTTASKASTSSSCSCVGVQRGGCASRLELHRSIPERPRPSRLLGAAPRCRSRRRKIGLWSMILVGHGPHGFFQRVRASQNLLDASCEYIYCWGGSMPPLLQGGIVSGRPARTFKMPPKCDAKFYYNCSNLYYFLLQSEVTDVCTESYHMERTQPRVRARAAHAASPCESGPSTRPEHGASCRQPQASGSLTSRRQQRRPHKSCLRRR